jgi:hypothetical protein
VLNNDGCGVWVPAQGRDDDEDESACLGKPLALDAFG